MPRSGGAGAHGSIFRFWGILIDFHSSSLIYILINSVQRFLSLSSSPPFVICFFAILPVMSWNLNSVWLRVSRSLRVFIGHLYFCWELFEDSFAHLLIGLIAHLVFNFWSFFKHILSINLLPCMLVKIFSHSVGCPSIPGIQKPILDLNTDWKRPDKWQSLSTMFIHTSFLFACLFNRIYF
jgi:hypothetical protein